MILELFIVLVMIAMTLIVIGLARPHESAQALVGFFLLFILGMLILNSSLEYDTGSNITSSLTYDVAGNLNSTHQVISYSYKNFDGTTAHSVGLYLSIAAVVGFIGVIISLRGGLRS